MLRQARPGKVMYITKSSLVPKLHRTVLSHLHRESQSQIYYNIWKSCPLSKHGEATVQCVNTQLQDPLKFNEYKQMTYLDKHLALLSHLQAQLYLEYLILRMWIRNHFTVSTLSPTPTHRLTGSQLFRGGHDSIHALRFRKPKTLTNPLTSITKLKAKQ